MLSSPAPDFGLLFDALPTPHLALTADHTVAAANAAMCQWLGRPVAALVGTDAATALPLAGPGPDWQELLRALGQHRRELTVQLHTPAGLQALLLRPVPAEAAAELRYVLALPAPPPTAAAGVRRQQEQFRFLSEFIPQLVWTTNAQGQPDYFNQRWLDYTGLPGLSAPDPAWTTALHPTDAPAAAQRWQLALAGAEPYRAELRLRAHDGRYRWFLVQALPLRSAQGRVSQWLGTCTDIDDAKRVQQRLLAKDRQLQQILGEVPAYVATLFGTEHICSFVTPNFQALLGGRLRVGWSVRETVAEFQEQGLLDLLDEAYRSGRTLTQPARLLDWLNAVTGQHTRRYYDLTLQPLLTEQGLVQGVLFFAIDATERVQAQQRSERLAAAGRRRNEQVRSMTEALPLISFSQAPSGRIVYVSPQWGHYTGVPTLAGRGRDWRSFVHPDDLAPVATSFARARRARTPWTTQLRLRRHDGHYCWHLVRSLPVFDAQDRLSRWYGSLTDVHEQQELHERLRRSEERFRFLTQSVPHIIWTADAAGRLDYLSPQWFRLTGQNPQDPAVLGPEAGWQLALHPSDAAATRARLLTALQTRRSFMMEARLRRRDGQYRWHLVHGVPELGPDGEVLRFFGSNTDIHEQYELQAELRRSEVEFRFLADSIPQLVWTLEPDGTPSFLNEEWQKYTGLTLPEVQQHGWGTLVPEPERALAERTLGDNVRLGRVHEHENRLRRAADGQYRWHLHRARPMRDADGRIVRWFGTSTDIDDYKRFQHEVEARNAELVRINQDLDNFVYTASHDLRQPIDNMGGIFHELVRSARFDDPEAPALVTMFEHSLEQIYTTIQELSALVQAQKHNLTAAPEQVRLERLTQEVLHSIGEQIRNTGAVVETDFAEVPAVEFIRPNLQSVLYNLLSNAVKYRAPDRPPRIRVWTQRLPAGGTQLTVQDNGLGIDLARHGKDLFQLFRRFHDHVPGSGTGLYLVQRLVQAHGGQLEVESQVGEGTTFRVKLPNAENGAARAE
ncbi:PAS domain S-box protein [Hymenobacter sp. 15J16-1T3B]|uniref:PAS domain S-box protein n=1 Tax=Hymenobacter sp. 15J16-1T3B TaxID=2886941 RepID=UPI001D0FDB55|nr:PAS domain S-box protein [Hymenobacter sp. 15J16-1T3B]MCC3156727.1 PAS domain S-box protein [Hymenobacter sp. 15J16-1T3B]